MPDPDPAGVFDGPRKVCSKCAQALPHSAFNRLTKAPDGLQYYCRECNREWHRLHKEHHNQLIHARMRRLRRDGAQRILEYLRTHPCVDCGEEDPVVLDFDHLSDKVADVSALVRNRLWPWERLLTEIAKCEVVCANCHRRRTSRRANTFRYRATRQRPPDLQMG